MVRRLNIDGDGQGDLAGHGGEQRAVLVYQTDSYRYWEKFLGRNEIEYGAFGENFTVDGLSDEDVCIGDRYRVGNAEFEVTQPRVTCFRVGIRMGEPRLPSLLVAHHRPGFYLRVLTEGAVQAGDQITRTRRGPHRLSVADIDALLYLPDRDRAKLRAAVDIPALSPGWRTSFEDLLTTDAGGPDLGTEPAEPVARTTTSPSSPAPTRGAPVWPGFRPLTVTKIVAETANVNSIYLRGADNAPLPQPVPGQYLTIRLPDTGTPAAVRNYSLSGDCTHGTYRISVKREPYGRVSSYLHTHLRPGDQLEAAAPRGDFVLGTGNDPVLLISAGIGVTPLLAMLHQLAAEHSTRDVWWLHTAHDADTHTFAREAAELIDSLPRAHALIYLTTPSHPLDRHSGITAGRLTSKVLKEIRLPTEASAYICGPERFMNETTAALVDAGMDATGIHTERFGSRSPINPGVITTITTSPHLPAGPPGHGPSITFARSDLTVPWSNTYGSLIELAEACDIPTQWSCRTGVCHTCATAVLVGQATYTSPPLDPPAGDELLICSAKPTSELVIDL
jgi:ferredoxin-NADP reductase/MOSC domain-containing protein YiiM/ferredoxin